MPKPIIKIDDAGVKSFLHSKDMENYLNKLGKAMTQGDSRYIVEPYERPSRKAVNIVDRHHNARAHEAATGKLAAMSINYITEDL